MAAPWPPSSRLPRPHRPGRRPRPRRPRFPPGGALGRPRDLEERGGGYAAASRPANPWRAYRTDGTHVARWCAAQDPPVPALPAAPATLARSPAAHAASHRPAPRARRCAVSVAAHDLAGRPSPARDEQVKTVLSGIRRRHGTRPARMQPAVSMRCGPSWTPSTPSGRPTSGTGCC
ncbi:hypothetical protein [Pseudonocardia sp. H11422]|uniref:hypothetical protein n=1 Tax=Pseudonocardia sp. H11422 TaxID=2835866 RepID=UPI0029300CB5|nr:hypothetical protein [Pseudonocardia sp. H11422]